MESAEDADRQKAGLAEIGCVPKNKDLLRELPAKELALLREVCQLGAALEEDLALQLDRLGDDLRPEIESLRRRAFLHVRTVERHGERTEIYLAPRAVRELL